MFLDCLVHTFSKSQNPYYMYSRHADRQACTSKTKSSLGQVMGIKSIHGGNSSMLTPLLIDSIWI